MWKLLNQWQRFAPHVIIQKSNITDMGSVKAGKAKTLSTAFSNILHYVSSFYRRLNSFAEQGMGIHAKDC